MSEDEIYFRVADEMGFRELQTTVLRWGCSIYWRRSTQILGILCVAVQWKEWNLDFHKAPRLWGACVELLYIVAETFFVV